MDLKEKKRLKKLELLGLFNPKEGESMMGEDVRIPASPISVAETMGMMGEDRPAPETRRQIRRELLGITTEPMEIAEPVAPPPKDIKITVSFERQIEAIRRKVFQSLPEKLKVVFESTKKGSELEWLYSLCGDMLRFGMGHYKSYRKDSSDGQFPPKEQDDIALALDWMMNAKFYLFFTLKDKCDEAIPNPPPIPERPLPPPWVPEDRWEREHPPGSVGFAVSDMKPFVLQGPFNPSTQEYEIIATPYFTSPTNNVLIYEKVPGSEDEEYNEDKDKYEILATYFPVGLQVYKSVEEYSSTRTVPGNVYSYNVEKYPSMLPWRQQGYEEKDEIPKAWLDLKPHQLILHRTTQYDEKKDNYYSFIPGTERDYLIVKTSKGWDSDMLGEWDTIKRDRPGIDIYDIRTLKKVGKTSSGSSAKKWRDVRARIKGDDGTVFSRWLSPLYNEEPPPSEFQSKMKALYSDITAKDGKRAPLYLATDFVPMVKRFIEIWNDCAVRLGINPSLPPYKRIMNYYKGDYPTKKELPTSEEIIKSFDTPFWKGDIRKKTVQTTLTPAEKTVVAMVGFGSRFSACLASLKDYISNPAYSEINKKRREIKDGVEPIVERAEAGLRRLRVLIPALAEEVELPKGSTPPGRTEADMSLYWRTRDNTIAKFQSKTSLKDIRDAIEFCIGIVDVGIKDAETTLKV
jgi:hypothetical protein